MPHTPLYKPGIKTIGDELHEAFPAPTTTSDDDILTSDATTDLGHVSDEGMVRFLGGNAGSIDSLNRDSIASVSDRDEDRKQNDANSSDEDNSRQENDQEYQTTGSVSHEAIEMQIMAQVHDNE